MEKLLSKKVIIFVRDSIPYRGFVTSIDDEFICLNEKVYIMRKYIISITIK